MARLTENLNLQRALLQHLDSIGGGLELLQKVKVESIQREDREGGHGWPLVHLSNGNTLRARLLVSRPPFLNNKQIRRHHRRLVLTDSIHLSAPSLV